MTTPREDIQSNEYWKELITMLSYTRDEDGNGLALLIEPLIGYYGTMVYSWTVQIGDNKFYGDTLEKAMQYAIEGMKRNQTWRICWRFEFETISKIFTSDWTKDFRFIQIAFSEIKLKTKDAWVENSLTGRLPNSYEGLNLTPGEIELLKTNFEEEFDKDPQIQVRKKKWLWE